MSLIVYLAKEDHLVIYNPGTEYLLFIKNSSEPDKLPTEGLLELSQIYGKKITADHAFDYFVHNYTGRVDDDTTRLDLLGRICRELDTYDKDEVENHLIVLVEGKHSTNENESEQFVETLDMINEEGFYSVGSYSYNTEFNRISYPEISNP